VANPARSAGRSTNEDDVSVMVGGYVVGLSMQPIDDSRRRRAVPEADPQFFEVDCPILEGLLEPIRAESPDINISLILDNVCAHTCEFARSRASARDPPGLSPGRTTAARSDRIAPEESQVIDLVDLRLDDRSVLPTFEASFAKLTH
jgi:hypothetical protein